MRMRRPVSEMRRNRAPASSSPPGTGRCRTPGTHSRARPCTSPGTCAPRGRAPSGRRRSGMSEEGRRWAARCWLQVRDASALCSRPSPSRHRRRTRAARTSRSAVRRPPAAATRLKRAEEGGEEAPCAVKADVAPCPRRVPVVHRRPSGRGPRTSSRSASHPSARRSSRTSTAAASSPRSTARAPAAGDVGSEIWATSPSPRAPSPPPCTHEAAELTGATAAGK